MEPVQLTLHSQTGFIKIDYMSVYQQLFNRIIGWFNVLCTSCICIEGKCLRWAVIENILEKVSDAFQRDKLVVGLVDCHRPDTVAILHRCGDVWWKLCHVARIAIRTCLDLCLMFRYFDSYGRNVKYLPLLVVICFNIFESCAAHGASICDVHFYMIRLFNRFQCATNMPLLPAVLLVARFSLAFGAGRLFESIAGRGLAAVFAVLIQLILQGLQLILHGL
uniref:Uncharacterized protein n=1 Tax=Candidatus Methanogaster sp. ANME-2c ERB4 TaxID=2759911 RepID=A0A7G9Y000_9EURY|nr:hypothetical protein CJOJDLJA_00001 [Methanosarcinales archaeon ANME-2c ERB4]